MCTYQVKNNPNLQQQQLHSATPEASTTDRRPETHGNAGAVRMQQRSATAWKHSWRDAQPEAREVIVRRRLESLPGLQRRRSYATAQALSVANSWRTDLPGHERKLRILFTRLLSADRVLSEGTTPYTWYLRAQAGSRKKPI